MTIKQALQFAYKELNHLPQYHQEGDLLLATAMSESISWVLAHPEIDLGPMQEKKFLSYIKRRSQHEPIAYILGFQPFYGRNFFVDKNVLIPRPEPEIMVNELKKRFPSNHALHLLDIGTGSGCLAITCALEFPNSTVIGLDISNEALSIAVKNSQNLQATNCTFLQSDLLEIASKNNLKVDVILANLPYLASKDIETSPTSKDVQYEPSLALLADDDGLALIKKCTEQAMTILNPNGILILEMLPRQIRRFQLWTTKKSLPYKKEIYQDLNGDKRGLILTKIV